MGEADTKLSRCIPCRCCVIQFAEQCVEKTLRASERRMLRQTVERKPHHNPISEADNNGDESDKSDTAHWEGLKHASDADETSELRRSPDG